MRRVLGRALPILVGAVIVGGVVGGLAGGALSSNDPYFPEQWGLTRIGAPAAWTRSTGAGVRIGVVDTGIDLLHEDLASKVVTSVGCIGSNDIQAACAGSAQDDQGHGTHVSGIAAAATGNGRGIAGIAPDAQLVVVKALGPNGNGALNDVNAGIKWAVDHGARVVNLSLEADSGQFAGAPGESLREGVEYAWAHQAIPVVAAGNSTPSLFGPDGYAGVDAVVVGATGRHDELSWYSSALTNAKWGLVAPGGDARAPDGRASCAGALSADCVVSTGWFAGHTNAYADDEGTSMATPHVAGVLALLLAQGLGPEAAVTRLLATADRIPCGEFCHGRLDAAAAVGAPPGASPAPATVLPAGGSSQPAVPPPTAGGLAPPRSPGTGPGPPVPPPSATTAVRPVSTVAPGPAAVGPRMGALGSRHRTSDPVPLLAWVAVGLIAAVIAEAVVVARVAGVRVDAGP